MQVSTGTTFRNMSNSAAIRRRIGSLIDELCRFHPEIESCHVLVEAFSSASPTSHQYAVYTEIKHAGGQVVVGRDRRDGGRHEHLIVAIAGAFAASDRQLRSLRKDASCVREPLDALQPFALKHSCC